MVENPSQVEILTASWRDLKDLRQLEKVCFAQDAWPLIDLIAVLSFPDVVRLKAVDDGLMIGFIAGDPRRSQGVAWIATLAVLPAYQRRGIGSRLLSACEDALTPPRIRLSVRKSNFAAIQLYERFGYQQIGIWPKYYQGGEDALVFEKAR